MNKVYAIVMLLTVCAATAWAQSAAPSVLIVQRPDKPGQNGQKSEQAATVAGWLVEKLEKAIHDKYSCVDLTDDQTVGAVLKFEHDRSVLDSNYQSDLSQLAGSLGARYLLIVSVTEVGGQTYLSTSAVDTKTNKPVEMKDAHAASVDDALDAAETLAKTFVNGLGSLFAGRCDPHWVGTITAVYKQERGEEKSEPWLGGTSHLQWNETTEDRLEIVLMATEAASDGAAARLTHAFKSQYTDIKKYMNGRVWCRKTNVQAHEEIQSFGDSVITEETGNASGRGQIYIHINPDDGTYDAGWSADPLLKTTQTETRSGSKPGPECAVEPYNEQKNEEREYRGLLCPSLEGRVDPKNPNTLSGTATRGNIKDGICTVTWNLRYVKPGR